MADQPENTPVTPDENPVPAQPEPKPEQQEQGPTGWHEPPVPNESSRPVVVEAWFQPENAVSPDEVETPPAETETSPGPAPQAAPPDTSPEMSGVWFTPPDAALDDLFSGADETIAEVHDSHAPPAQVDQATQPQASAETQAQPIAEGEGWEVPADDEDVTRVVDAAGEDETPLPDATGEMASATEEPAASDEHEQTPVPDATTPQQAASGLTAAEQAMLVEQRAEGQLPEREPDEEQTDVTRQFAAQQEEEPAPADSQANAPADQEPSRFEQVERQVQVLRERYQQGQMTRPELEAELRRLMIMGDDGHWWMMGLESRQWYYYDGHNWVAGTPPGYDERVRGSTVRTETGMQEVAPTEEGYFDPESGQEATLPPVEDEDSPLPQRVPQEDPAATMVSPNSAFLEPMRSSEAPTESHTRPVDAGSAGVVPHPQSGQGLPQRPEQREETDYADQTMRSEAFSSQATMPGSALAVQQQQQIGQTRSESGAVADRPGMQPQAKPKPRLGEFPQPDYSAALGPSRTWTSYVKWGAVFTVIGGMLVTLVVLLIMIGYYLYKVDQYAEAVTELSELASDFENTVIYDAAGDPIAEFISQEAGSRTEVPLDEISPWLIHATIATENETFYTDPGFSVLAIVRAAVQNLQAGDTVSGASTITQQLARALVLETEFAYQRTAERKIVEIIVASEIKRNYTKNEILEIYLNEIFYGNFAYGIEAAAQTYFGKPAAELNPVEAAFLAGLPQSPAQYDPVVNREAALARMHEVLRLMTEATGDGCIAIEHQDSTMWQVPQGGELCLRAEEQPDGSMGYYYRTPNTDWVELFGELALVEIKTFTAPSTEFTHPHFVNYVWQQLEDTYGPQAIYAAGYRVYTTLDETIQQAAENEMRQNLQRIRDQGYPANNTSVVAIRPSDGAVVAMVGSADYDNEQIKGQVNVAFTAQQPGSTLKPFIYLTAFRPDEQGDYMTPASVIWDVYTNFNGYEPTNYDKQYHGPVTAREALGTSLNVPAVKALNYTGLLRFTELMTRLGVTFPGGNPVETNAGLPTALGAVDVQLFNLTAAYATLANRGQKVEPYSIVYIEDSQGNPVYEAQPQQETEQVVDPVYAYLVTDIISDPDARASEFGYGWPMQLTNNRPAAVKTGTSNDSRDVWTIGYTPQLAVGVWVGTTDNEPMYNQSGYPTYYLTGYYGAAPLWNAIMEAAHADKPIEPFQPPQGVIQVEVCEDSGVQASEACVSGRYVEIFANSAPPPGPDEGIFRTLQIDTYTNLLANESCPNFTETRTFLAVDDPAAYDWINNTDAGRAWANARGISVPIPPAPNQYCEPNQPRPYLEISYPSENATVQGVVEVRGTVIMPQFNRYELRYGIGHDPDSFSPPLMVGQNAHPDANSLLGQWDTQPLETGPYTIQVIAYDELGRSVAREVRINVNNPQPTAVPTALPTATLAPTLTPAGGTAATPQPPGAELPTATLAPTLTPTWTSTPTPQGQ